jgi:hypothetical protein
MTSFQCTFWEKNLVHKEQRIKMFVKVCKANFLTGWLGFKVTHFSIMYTEAEFSLRFLGIILRVLRLYVSV